MEKYHVDTFLKDLESLGIFLSGEQTEQFLCYYEMLVEWNGKMNLTAITAFEDVLKKHFVDSLSLIKVCDLRQDLNLIDVRDRGRIPGSCLKDCFSRTESHIVGFSE